MTLPSVPTPDATPTDQDPVAPDAPDPSQAPDEDGPDGAPAADEVARRRRRRWWVGGAVAAVVLTGLVGALFIPTPYYLLQPGSVRPAEARIEVDGAKAYEDEGDILFTTVYVDRATLATLLRGAVDDAIDVKSEQEVYGPDGRDASQKANRQRMDLSKLIATKVALNYLGYPAEFTGKGARILELGSGTSADELLEPGDVITAVNGMPVALPADISPALTDKVPGDVVTVTARRTTAPGDGSSAAATTETIEGPITLAAAKDDQARAILGVSVDPDQPSLDSPVTVDIDSGEVTGPSAGMAWALAVIDRLTPGSITDGREVAVTGEILADGSIGTIGGITQKVSAVKRAGVKLFLYPADTPEDEQQEMRRIADGQVELRPVATVQEAVEVLVPGGLQPAA